MVGIPINNIISKWKTFYAGAKNRPPRQHYPQYAGKGEVKVKRQKIKWDDIESRYDESRGVMTLTRGNKSLEIMVFPADAVARLQAIAAQVYAENKKVK